MTTEPFDITSPSNPRVRALAALRDRRERERAGRFLVEGHREVTIALAAGAPVLELVVAPELTDVASWEARAGARGVPVLRVSERAFRKLSVRRHPDGVAAVAATLPVDLERVAHADPILVADGIEKPGNLGAMLRTADAAGAGVIVSDPTVDPFNPNVVRASQGALFTVPLAVAAADAAIGAVEGRTVVVATPEASAPYWDLDLTRPLAIVVGREDRGVSPQWRTVGTPAAIPMRGTVDSLNASVSAAILLYEALRQRSRGA